MIENSENQLIFQLEYNFKRVAISSATLTRIPTGKVQNLKKEYRQYFDPFTAKNMIRFKNSTKYFFEKKNQHNLLNSNETAVFHRIYSCFISTIISIFRWDNVKQFSYVFSQHSFHRKMHPSQIDDFLDHFFFSLLRLFENRCIL